MKWDKSKGRPEPIAALNRVVERENHEPLALLSVAAPSVVISRESVIPYLRQTVAEMLENAAHSLEPAYKIAVVDAWRPFQRQVRIYQWMHANLMVAKPDISHAAARRMLCRFVAPIDQKAPPGHTTGAAVDVNLLDSNGKLLDTVSPFKRLDGAPTFVFGLDPTAHDNRMVLVQAMLGAGFSNCRDEWWHYSYGDAGWAVRMDRKECCYTRIDMPEDIYAKQMDAWEEIMRGRGNPFLKQD